MSEYLQPVDDGLLMRKSGPWVAEKLDYLKRYIYIFETSLHDKPWRKRIYIDLFAGPGKCLIRRTGTVLLGSPLLALTTLHPFTDYFFVDQQPANIDALKQRCSDLALHDHIQYFTGDSNIIVEEIVRQILDFDKKNIPGKYSSLNLAFLDPDGLELQWNTILTLARPYSMDLIIHYPQGGLNRCMAKFYQAEEHTAVDFFFGDSEWRNLYKKHGNNHRVFMDYYKGKLSALGYKEVLRDDEVGDEPLMRNAQKQAPLYRLLFASKHSRGHEFWRKVTQRNVHGQKRLL